MTSHPSDPASFHDAASLDALLPPPTTRSSSCSR